MVLADVTEFGLSGLLLETEVSTAEHTKDGRMRKRRFRGQLERRAIRSAVREMWALSDALARPQFGPVRLTDV